MYDKKEAQCPQLHSHAHLKKNKIFLHFLLLLCIFFFIVVFLFLCMAADFVYMKTQLEMKQQCKRECGEKSKERVCQRRDWDDAGEVLMAAFSSDSG